MATEQQVRAAKQNIDKAQQAVRQRRTLAHLPAKTSKALGEEAAEGRQRSGAAGHALEDRNRSQLYDVARDMNIKGRSKMGKWELIDAIRARR